MNIEAKLVSVTEARRLLGNIGKTRLYEFIYSGDLERVKVGARACITVESIERLIDRLVRRSK